MFLSTPCADIIKEHHIYLDNIIKKIIEIEGWDIEEWDYRENFSAIYFKERDVFCDRCNCKLINPINRYMIEDYHNGTFCETCAKQIEHEIRMEIDYGYRQEHYYD